MITSKKQKRFTAPGGRWQEGRRQEGFSFSCLLLSAACLLLANDPTSADDFSAAIKDCGLTGCDGSLRLVACHRCASVRLRRNRRCRRRVTISDAHFCADWSRGAIKRNPINACGSELVTQQLIIVAHYDTILLRIDTERTAGVRVELIGSGRARNQDVAPGPAAAGTTVRVTFADGRGRVPVEAPETAAPANP